MNKVLPWLAGACTLYPIAWLIVAATSIMTDANSEWVAKPVVVYAVYGSFWLAPVLNLSGLAIAAIRRTHRHRALFFGSCFLIWLVTFALLSVAHR